LKNCADKIESLSAYIDGELTGSNKQLLEEHIARCDDCSTLVKIKREISTSISESASNVPDALRIGVMNRIEAEDIIFLNEDKKKFANQRTKKNQHKHQGRLRRLSGYAPIAAGLAVMLLVWQFWGDIFGGQDSAMNMAAPAVVQMTAQDSGGGMIDAADDQIESRVAEDLHLDDADAAFETETPGGSAPDVFSENESFPHQGEFRTNEETQQIMEYMAGAFAEITFTGKLPVLLAGHEPLPFGSWFGWEMVFEISSADVEPLLEEIGNREGLTVSRNHDNNESTYAIVLFSHG